jgi:hypothetical protein
MLNNDFALFSVDYFLYFHLLAILSFPHIDQFFLVPAPSPRPKLTEKVGLALFKHAFLHKSFINLSSKE